MGDPAILMKSKDSAIQQIRLKAFRNSRNLNILAMIIVVMLFF